MRATIMKWGNSPALRLPKRLAAGAGMVEGTEVDLTVEQGKIIVTPARPRLRLDDLLATFTPAHRHEEVEWGNARGEEAW